MSEHPQEQQVRPLCANHCGFYGNPLERSLCSKCYRETLQRENELAMPAMGHLEPKGPNGPQMQDNPAQATAAAHDSPSGDSPPISAPSEMEVASPVSRESGAEAEIATEEPKVPDCPTDELNGKKGDDVAADGIKGDQRPIQDNKERCWKCSRKSGIMGFTCRCGYVFCSRHRYADSHDCDFDYKTFERSQLEKRNKAVIASKMEKI